MHQCTRFICPYFEVHSKYHQVDRTENPRFKEVLLFKLKHSETLMFESLTVSLMQHFKSFIFMIGIVFKQTEITLKIN